MSSSLGDTFCSKNNLQNYFPEPNNYIKYLSFMTAPMKYRYKYLGSDILSIYYGRWLTLKTNTALVKWEEKANTWQTGAQTEAQPHLLNRQYMAIVQKWGLAACVYQFFNLRKQYGCTGIDSNWKVKFWKNDKSLLQTYFYPNPKMRKTNSYCHLQIFLPTMPTDGEKNEGILNNQRRVGLGGKGMMSLQSCTV